MNLKKGEFQMQKSKRKHDEDAFDLNLEKSY